MTIALSVPPPTSSLARLDGVIHLRKCPGGEELSLDDGSHLTPAPFDGAVVCLEERTLRHLPELAAVGT